MIVPLAKLRRDGGTQSRATLCQDTVAEYAASMADRNTDFPPAVVFFDGKDHWLADGFHRVAAWQRIGRNDIPAEVRQGDRRDAILFACSANAAHGLRRTNADKRRAVLRLLEDDAWSKWSNREIARRCLVSEGFVRSLRTKRSEDEPCTFVTKHGTEAQMNASRIGKTARACGKEPCSAYKTAVPLAADTSGTILAESSDSPSAGRSVPDPYRNGLSGLSREGLADECAGLRAKNAELGKQIERQTDEITELSAQIKELSASDHGATIRSLHKRIAAADFQRDEAMREAKREQLKRKKAEEQLAELERSEVPY